MEACKRALEKTETSEYEAVGINVSKKLEKMDSVQAIYAERLINEILSKGLLNQITPNTSIMESNLSLTTSCPSLTSSHTSFFEHEYTNL